MLESRSGSELYTAELAERLLALGHSAVIYTPAPGPLARELQERAIPVVSDLRMVTEPPDIIHGHHTHETLTALLAFPGVPAVQVHHGWVGEPPASFPRILRHVAVDDTVRDRMVSEWGVPTSSVDVIRNFIDPARLPMRGPLPARPARGLVFSNRAAHHLDIVRAACRSSSIAVDAVGIDVDRVSDDPGTLLPAYDIVFAKARCAMEAIAAGCAVILCDRSGVGPMVTSHNFDEMRRLNFGLRTLRAPLSVESLAAALGSYDPDDARAVTTRLRAEATIDDVVARWLDTYERVLAEWRDQPRCVEDELRATSLYLQRRTVEPTPGVAAGTLLKTAYFSLARKPVIRRLLPSPRWAQRLYNRLKGPSHRH